MKTSDFPGRIFVADMAPADAHYTELIYTDDASKVAGLPVRIYRPEPELDWERLALVKTHPLRISILEVLSLDGGRVLSPSEIAFELQQRLANTCYHVKELAKTGFIELVGTKPRRGATEHYYRLPARGGGSP